ncbi:MAG: division/cell wall cluster transcriptional repressor MraZ [Clostridia bacterium]|nr:division/cell wall cluster transcriptional repressor MraZ [Clostridia bacterium]
MESVMLIGEYQHNIDPKGRVFIPVHIRDDLGGRFIVTKGIDGCLCAYSMSALQVLETKLRGLPMSRARDLQRFFFSGAADVEIDRQGRVLISAALREYAALTKDVVITGQSDHAEIWDKQRWEQVCAGITPEKVKKTMDEYAI